MEWTLLTKEDYVTTTWSGGTTTQLAIAPEGAVYADRDFLWRFSSAGLIATLKGGLDMKVGEGERFSLVPYQLYSFDGGVPVESWGQCTDFNLMLRKGQCEGTLQALTLAAGADLSWTAPVSAPQSFSNRAIAIYCGEGEVTLPEEGKTVKAGQFLLCRRAEDRPIHMESAQGARLMTAVIYSR